MSLRVLAIGDVVGRPGRTMLRRHLRDLRRREEIDLVVANGENASGGAGITPQEAREMLDSGVDVLTGGDHIWGKKEIIPFIQSERRLIRPANYPAVQPGEGHAVIETPRGPVAVLHLVGRVFLNNLMSECPFATADRLLPELRKRTPVVAVDFHAEATAEKVAMGWHLNGRASFVFGTHTHVQTADERVLSRGTAYITDCGMTGPYESVIGRRIDRVLHKFLTQMPVPFDVAESDSRICGAVAEIDPASGRALSIRRIVVREDGTYRRPGDPF